ncbi:hypothetical protein PR202_gb15007 [Eleusine coracana subsp. coracana]|uniref:Uncharacterized protein n=1 Tax=Eleusine coracana subsp. coracana TaxID=191504 RepID=A0AAV5EUF6_ELECO|nr:hypothetical protein PR202_gb15007 [Eleusine coracana subsp. coracana]
MEVRVLQVGLGLLFLLAAQHAPAVAIPSPQCQKMCGNVEIEYPFGIGENCSLTSDFNVSCQVIDGITKPFIDKAEVLNISLTNGTMRMLNHIASTCYNTSSRSMDFSRYGGLNARGSAYRFSDTQNKFTVIGCNTLAFIYDSNGTGYQSGMDYYRAGFAKGFNTSQIWNFSRCSYAVLMESAAFNFSTAYITTNKFNNTFSGRVPTILDWAIRNGTMSCPVATRNESGTYACLSSNSDCVNSTNGPGYICNCSKGYEGNPYLPGGCKDVNECNQSPCPSRGGICHNEVGRYRCSCTTGRKFSKQNNTCDLDNGLIIGVTIGFLVLVIFSCSGYMLNSYTPQTTTIRVELIGKEGYGTVYKGIIKDKMHVAIKRCTLISERQKKEFGQEMLILSQINHKNIVKLVGCCLEVEVPMLVYEFIPNGTLYELIHGKNRALQISFSTLLRIAHEAAEGLNFLHSYASPPIIHGDVKTANILLDENYMAKVADFGASILAPSDEEQYVTMVQGTCGYLDPEYMQTCQLTDKSDVYSFGVILLEVLTGQVPLKLEGDETQRSLSSNFLSAMKENNVDALLVSHVKGKESTELIRGLAELAKQCLNMCGVNRPTMKEVVDELGRLRKLALHPWVRITNTESESLLDGPSSTGFEIDVATTTGYPTQEGDNAPMNPNSSYYAR